MSVYAVKEPVRIQAITGHAVPAATAEVVARTSRARSAGGNGSRRAVAIRWAPCSTSASAKARPRGRVNAMTTTTGASST